MVDPATVNVWDVAELYPVQMGEEPGHDRVDPTLMVSVANVVDVSGNSQVIPTDPVNESARVTSGQSRKAHPIATNTKRKARPFATGAPFSAVPLSQVMRNSTTQEADNRRN
jgi:hypothetical protein